MPALPESNRKLVVRLKAWGHSLFALGTGAVAAATMALLASLRPQTDAVAVVLAGAVVLLSGGLCLEVLARRAQQARQEARLLRLHQGYEDLVERILRQRDAGSGARTAQPPEPEPVRPPSIRSQRVPPPPAPPPSEPPALVSQGSDDADGSAATNVEDGIAAVIREALADQRIEFHLQPIVSLPQRKPRFYEVLSRIRLPDGGVLGPERFLPTAQREHLLAPIDLLVMARTTQLIRETDRRQHAIGFFCNIAPVTLLDARFQAQFVRSADHAALRTKLMFEVSQRDVLAEVPAVMNALSELRRLGYRFSMAQIEHQEINLDWAASQEIHYLKVDAARLAFPDWRAAVGDLQGRLAGSAIEVIAERIETERQLADAQELGLGLGQGFLLGEPRPSRRPSS